MPKYSCQHAASPVFVSPWFLFPHRGLFDAEEIIQSSCQLKHLCVLLCDFTWLCAAPIKPITAHYSPAHSPFCAFVRASNHTGHAVEPLPPIMTPPHLPPAPLMYSLCCASPRYAVTLFWCRQIWCFAHKTPMMQQEGSGWLLSVLRCGVLILQDQTHRNRRSRVALKRRLWESAWWMTKSAREKKKKNLPRNQPQFISCLRRAKAAINSFFYSSKML